jgi:hypothetical protein
MYCRFPATALMCLMLQGCQPPTYDILARIEGADLILEARGSGSWPFRDDDGIEAHWVSVRDSSRLLWAIELDPSRPNCRASGPTPPFPLVYGRVPRCYLERIPAKALREGVLVRVEGEGFRSGTGHFRLTRAVLNVEGGHAWKERESWPELPDPRYSEETSGTGAGTADAPAPDMIEPAP